MLTGASGALGRQLAPALQAQGWTLRLTDRVPFPDALPANATFTLADLEDGVAILRLAEGCGTIVHFGGASTEQPFEAVIGPNIRGLYHVYEAARREKARVVFASSNHAIGFHERDQKLDAACSFRPDGYYGLSKAYAELMGRMYWDKHGVENVNLRIGSCFPKPVDARMLSTWLSYEDLAALVVRAVAASQVGHAVVWGASDNARSFWGHDQRDRLDWQPKESADFYSAEVKDIRGKDLIAERYQGGSYPAMEYSRDTPSPVDPFTSEA